MKKGCVIGIVLIVAVVSGLGGWYFSQSKNNKADSNNEINSNENSVENNYVRYTETTILEDLKVKIENKKLTMIYKNKNITVKNLPENIKYFTYVIDCGGHTQVAALDYNGVVYYSWFDFWDFDEESTDEVVDYVSFDKVESEKIKDLTVKDIPAFTTCGNDAIYVITEDSKEKAISYDETNKKCVLGNEYSVDYPYLVRVGMSIGLYLYEDGKVKIGYDEDVNKNDYLNITAKAVYKLYDLDEDESSNTNSSYYIIDANNKLYNVIYTLDKNENITKVSLKLVSDKVIKNTNSKDTKFINYENPTTVTITYTDGTTYELKNVSEMYYLKKI